jgi:uncharacterized protein
MSVRNIVFGLMLLATAPATSLNAQQAPDEKSRLAAEMIEVMQTEKTMSAIYPAMMKQISDILIQQNPAVKKDLDYLMANAEKELMSNMSPLKVEMAKIYAARFSETELRDMVTFMKSPSGKRFIEEQPAIATESMRIGQQWGQQIGERIFEKMRTELRAKGHKI